VAVRPDPGAAAIAGRGLAVRGDAKDLAAERAPVLRQLRPAGLAGRDVQQPVGAEGDPAAVVVAGLGDARDDRLQRADAAAVAEPHHPVVAGSGEVQVDEAIPLVRG
jgi:hypothetical protein